VAARGAAAAADRMPTDRRIGHFSSLSHVSTLDLDISVARNRIPWTRLLIAAQAGAWEREWEWEWG
jgi:hypothetical protein